MIARIALFLILCATLLTSTVLGVRPAAAAMIDYPVVKLQSLDKMTARTMVFEARVGATVQFGPLYIKVRACRKAPPIETPESAAFLQIWEVTPKEESKWIFSGWMFASSPALSPMDHPVYDVWVIDCLEAKTGEEAAAPAAPEATTPSQPAETIHREEESPEEALPAGDSEASPE